MFPERTITGKNALSQQSSQGPKPLSNSEVLEVCGEDCFDVLWLSRDPELLAHRDGRICVTNSLKTLDSLGKDLLGFEQSDLLLEILVADNALGLLHLRCILAAMGLGKAIILDVCE